MRKLFSKLLPVALLAIAAPAAIAQSTGDVAIGGTIVPNSCTLTFANGGVIDLGQIPAATLVQSGLGSNIDRSVSASVACSGPTLLMYTLVDNRIATLPPAHASSTGRMGLGVTSTGKPVGTWVLWWTAATRQGVAGTVLRSSDGTSWFNDSGTQWGKSNIASPVNPFRAIDNGTPGDGPIPYNMATFQMTARINLLGRNDLQLTGAETIDGSATIEIVYL